MTAITIGLSGYARSGKDTVGSYLVKEYGFTRLAFADALKDAVYILNPLVPDKSGHIPVSDLVDEYGWEGAKNHPEVRRLLQVMGTDVGRALLGEDVWVEVVRKKLYEDLDRDYVITDCRYPNEAIMIADEGGEVWRISRPRTKAINTHSSETSLDGWDFDAKIANDGSLPQLYEKIDKLMEDR